MVHGNGASLIVGAGAMSTTRHSDRFTQQYGQVSNKNKKLLSRYVYAARQGEICQHMDFID